MFLYLELAVVKTQQLTLSGEVLGSTLNMLASYAIQTALLAVFTACVIPMPHLD